MMEPDTTWRQRSGKMQLLFQSLLQHPGEVDPLRHCGIIQPRRNRKGFLDRLFKMAMSGELDDAKTIIAILMVKALVG